MKKLHNCLTSPRRCRTIIQYTFTPLRAFVGGSFHVLTVNRADLPSDVPHISNGGSDISLSQAVSAS